MRLITIVLLLFALTSFGQDDLGKPRHNQLKDLQTGSTDTLVYFQRNVRGWELVKDVLSQYDYWQLGIYGDNVETINSKERLTIKPDSNITMSYDTGQDTIYLGLSDSIYIKKLLFESDTSIISFAGPDTTTAQNSVPVFRDDTIRWELLESVDSLLYDKDNDKWLVSGDTISYTDSLYSEIESKWLFSGDTIKGDGTGITDAPSDGNLYARKDGAWASLPALTTTGTGDQYLADDGTYKAVQSGLWEISNDTLQPNATSSHLYYENDLTVGTGINTKRLTISGSNSDDNVLHITNSSAINSEIVKISNGGIVSSGATGIEILLSQSPSAGYFINTGKGDNLYPDRFSVDYNGQVKCLSIELTGGSKITSTGYAAIENTLTINSTAQTNKELLVNGDADIIGSCTADSIYTTKAGGWADHTFEKDYKLKSLNEELDFIKKNKHLRSLPSERERNKHLKKVYKKTGKSDSIIVEKISLQQMQLEAVGMLEEIEKLYLYIEQLNNKIEKLEQK